MWNRGYREKSETIGVPDGSIPFPCETETIFFPETR